jgi:hypothetical protein
LHDEGNTPIYIKYLNVFLDILNVIWSYNFTMSTDWKELTALTQGKSVLVEKIRLAGTTIRIEGEFELPALARLRAEDQVFVAAFVRSHGSIKAMEDLFGISYPTIKNRLNRISGELNLVEEAPGPAPASVLDRLEKNEITVAQALEMLRGS